MLTDFLVQCPFSSLVLRVLYSCFQGFGEGLQSRFFLPGQAAELCLETTLAY